MNKALLLAGGLTLVAGGLAYWYFLQGGKPPVKKCSDYINQSDCEMVGCYWYNNSCHNDPQDYIPCSQGTGTCYPNLNGLRRCDRYNNLCECSNNNWLLIEKESKICIDNIVYDKCYANEEGQVICMEYSGAGTDECKLGYPGGCPCNPPSRWCQSGWECEPRIFECMRAAYQVPINIPPGAWSDCESTPGCDWNESGMRCFHILDDEYVATNIMGELYWEWGFPGTIAKLTLLGYLRGVGWTTLGYHEWAMWGTEGIENINMSFSLQGISEICFQMCGTAFTNVRPKAFYGHLNI